MNKGLHIADIYIHGHDLKIRRRHIMTRGLKGAYVRFFYDGEPVALMERSGAVFKTWRGRWEVTGIRSGEPVIIPDPALMDPFLDLFVGAWFARDNPCEIVPTLYANLGAVRNSAIPAK